MESIQYVFDVEDEDADTPLWPVGEGDGTGHGYGYGAMRDRIYFQGESR